LMTRGGEAGSVVEKASRWLLLQRRRGEGGKIWKWRREEGKSGRLMLRS
jgi:hypothetical protein